MANQRLNATHLTSNGLSFAELFESANVGISTETAGFEFDEVRPLFVARPSSQDGVAELLTAAHAQEKAVFPRGGSTQMDHGTPIGGSGIVLDLRGVNRVVEYEPADLTVTVEAGMTLAELQRVLGENGQWLPLDPPCSPNATIGGILATNASGPTRHSRGTARDLVIGMQFVTAEGSLVKSGGRVVKNVAGYDLGKLQIGALGTLGVITQATFKISPLPASTLTLAVQGDSLEKLASLTKTVAASQLPVQGMELTLRDEAKWALQIRIAAGQSAVERSRREVEALCRDAGLVVTEASESYNEALDGSVVRASVSQSALYGLLPAFGEIAARVVAYPSAGVAHIALKDGATADDVTSLRKRCVDAGGALVIERGPLELRRGAGVWGETRGDFAMMQRLKTELDPKCVLNPGRFVGGI